MASSRLKGITLEIGGDTTDLNKALSDVDSQIRQTGAQLKDVQKLLKMDPGNIDLLTQKQKLLTEQVKSTKSRLDELKKAQENMDANGVDKNSAQYQGLQREIIATEQELKNLESAARQSNVALEAIGATADKVAAGASKVAESTKWLSAAAGGAVAGIAGLAYNSMLAADDLNTLAQQTGFSTDELQKFQYASDLVDVSVESITGAVAKMTKAMESSAAKTSKSTKSSSDAFQMLGVRVKDSAGHMRDSTTVFYEVLNALSRVGNETLRDQLAMDIFGKSANELAGIIDDGGAALRAYGNEAEQLGLIMSGDALNGLNQVNDAFDRLKAQTKAQLMQTGAKALEAFLPILQQILVFIQQILNWVASLNPEQIKIYTTIGVIIGAISPVAGIVAGIAKAVSAVTAAVRLLNLSLLANPIVLAIGLIMAAVIALGVLIYQNADAIKAAWHSMMDAISNAWHSGWEAIKSAYFATVDAIRNGIAAIGEFFTNKINQILDAWHSMMDAISNAWNSAWEAIKAAFSAAADAIRSGIESIRAFFANGINMILEGWNTMISNITAAWQQLIGLVTEGWQNLVSGFREAASSVGQFFRDLANGVISFVENAVNSAIDSLNSLISAANRAANAVAGIFGGSVGTFGQVSNVRLPRFAKGGSLSNGTALVGEAGPELLTVNGGRATVQPLTARLDPAFLAGLSNLAQQQIKVNINFSGSLAQLAAVLQPKIQAEAARRGISLLK